MFIESVELASQRSQSDVELIFIIIIAMSFLFRLKLQVKQYRKK